MESFFLLAGLLASLLAAATGFAIRKTEIRIFNKERKPSSPSLGEKFNSLTKRLQETSNVLNDLMAELTTDIDNRSEALKTLEASVRQAEKREETLQKKVTALQNTSLPVADYLLEITNEAEKRSRRRDWTLFLAGSVFSTIVTITVTYLLS